MLRIVRPCILFGSSLLFRAFTCTVGAASGVLPTRQRRWHVPGEQRPGAGVTRQVTLRICGASVVDPFPRHERRPWTTEPTDLNQILDATGLRVGRRSSTFSARAGVSIRGVGRVAGRGGIVIVDVTFGVDVASGVGGAG